VLRNPSERKAQNVIINKTVIQMKNTIILILAIALVIVGCENNVQKKAETHRQGQEKATRDSLEIIKRIQLEKENAIKDSITMVEQDIAIGTISFNIPEKDFNKGKAEFLKKCKLAEYEFYKGSTIFTYKLGEYGFSYLYGWFHNDSLYNIELKGPFVEYNDYDRVMPDQYRALKNLLTQKYGEPSASFGLPKWTDLDKGYFKRCNVWEIGNKKIEIRISCAGVKYYLNLVVFKPHVEKRIKLEKQFEEKESTKKAVDIL